LHPTVPGREVTELNLQLSLEMCYRLGISPPRMAELLAGVGERARRVLLLILRGSNQTAIGAALGITQQAVSRIVAKDIEPVRRRILHNMRRISYRSRRYGKRHSYLLDARDGHYTPDGVHEAGAFQIEHRGYRLSGGTGWDPATGEQIGPLGFFRSFWSRAGESGDTDRWTVDQEPWDALDLACRLVLAKSAPEKYF